MALTIIQATTKGADPEIFLLRYGKPMTATEGGIKGTKGEPHPLSEEGHAVQVDNVMCEFNIPPCSTKEDFVESIQYCLNKIQKGLPEGGEICIQPSLKFDMKQLDNPVAREVGCSTDYDAYTTDEMPKIELEESVMRYAGGHVHLGYENADHENILTLVKLMDLVLGVPAVLLDNDTERKAVYGCAGRFRPTWYGLEYRVLSNFWIKSKELIEWVWDSVEKVVELNNSGFELTEEQEQEVIRAINENNAELAETLIEQHGLSIPKRTIPTLINA